MSNLLEKSANIAKSLTLFTSYVLSSRVVDREAPRSMACCMIWGFVISVVGCAFLCLWWPQYGCWSEGFDGVVMTGSVTQRTVVRAVIQSPSPSSPRSHPYRFDNHSRGHISLHDTSCAGSHDAHDQSGGLTIPKSCQKVRARRHCVIVCFSLSILKPLYPEP